MTAIVEAIPTGKPIMSESEKIEAFRDRLAAEIYHLRGLVRYTVQEEQKSRAIKIALRKVLSDLEDWQG